MTPRPYPAAASHTTRPAYWATTAASGRGNGCCTSRSGRIRPASSRPCACLSARRVAVGLEPVVAVGPGRRRRVGGLDRLAGGGGRAGDLGLVDRFALHPQLMPLPCLGLGHHLGDQVPAQPHLPRLPATAGARATIRWTRRLIHQRPAHPLAHSDAILGGRAGRPHGVSVVSAAIIAALR